MELHVFTHRKNMSFDDVRDLFRYLFWHWFLIILGIDFDSIVVILLASFSQLFQDRFVHRFGTIFDSKMVPPIDPLANHFQSKLKLFATSPSIFLHGGFFWKALGSLWLMLVPFWYLLAPVRHYSGNRLQMFCKFAGLSWVLLNSTFEGSQMLGPAELSTYW